MMDSIEFN